LGAGKNDCKLDYEIAAAADIASSITWDASTRTATYAQVDDATKCGIHDSTITAKSIAKELLQTSSTKQRAVFTLADCEADTTAHVSVVSGKETQTIDFELNVNDKPTWSTTIDLKGIFASSVANCFLTFETDWKTKDSTTQAVRDITTITADDVAQSVTISMTEADTNLAGTAQGMHVFTVTAKSTGGVTMNPVVTAEITLRTWYSTCKGANIVSSVNAFTPKEILLNAADET